MQVANVQRVASNVRHRIGRSGLLLILGFIAWCIWVGISSVTSPYDLASTFPYIVSPAALLLGLVTGGFLQNRWRRGKAIYVFGVVLIVTVISLPIYANASAAVGGLLIALIGLGVLDLREARQSNDLLAQTRTALSRDDRVLRQAIVLALILCAAVLLILDSQAAMVLTVPVALIIMFAVWRRSGPPQWIVVLSGCLVAAGAVLAVVFLGSRTSWPAWMAAGESLSSARHTLWSDALSLWATAPILGSGPGSFTPSSELASNTPSLAAVHSLPLQVGSELGAVGAVLLAWIFVGGLAFAARGSRPVALTAIAAWTALAVHSSIDHLEDFPVVAFMAGTVLGWSGFGENSPESPSEIANGVSRS